MKRMHARATPDVRSAPSVQPGAPRAKPVGPTAGKPAGEPTEREINEFLEILDAHLAAKRERARPLEAAVGPQVVDAVDKMLEMYFYPQTTTRERAQAAGQAMAKVAARAQAHFLASNRHLPREWLPVADRVLAVRRAAADQKDDLPMSPLARARFRTGGWFDAVPTDRPGLARRAASMVANSSGFQMATQASQRLNTLSQYYLSQGYERYLAEQARLDAIEEKMQQRLVVLPSEKNERVRILADTPGDYLRVDQTDNEDSLRVMLGLAPEDALRPDELRRVSARDRFLRMEEYVFANEATMAELERKRGRADKALLDSLRDSQEHFDRMTIARKETRVRYMVNFEKRRAQLASKAKNINLLPYAEFGGGGGWQNAVFQLTDYMNALAPEFSWERRDRPGWKKMVSFVGGAARICSSMGRVVSAFAKVERDLISERQQRFLNENKEKWEKAAEAQKIQSAVADGILGVNQAVERLGGGALKLPEAYRAGALYAEAVASSCANEARGGLMLPFGNTSSITISDTASVPARIETWDMTLQRTGLARLASGSTVALVEEGFVQNKSIVLGKQPLSQLVTVLSEDQLAYVIPDRDAVARGDEAAVAMDVLGQYNTRIADIAAQKIKVGGDSSSDAAEGKHLKGAISPMEASGVLAESVLEEISPTYRAFSGAYSLLWPTVSGYLASDETRAQVESVERGWMADLLVSGWHTIGGVVDWFRFGPVWLHNYMQENARSSTWGSLGLLFAYYRSLMVSWPYALGATVVQAITLAFMYDAREMFLLTSAAVIGVSLATNAFSYIFGRADDPTAPIRILQWLESGPAWAVRLYKRVFGDIPKPVYSAWSRASSFVRSAWNVALPVGGALTYAASMLYDAKVILQLLDVNVSTFAVIYSNPFALIGAGALTVGAIVGFATLANDWYHKSLDTAFSLGALVIERPDVTLLGIRLALQLMAANPVALASSVVGSALATLSTLVGFADYGTIMGYVDRVRPSSDDPFLALWNIVGGAVWPLITVSFPANPNDPEEVRLGAGRRALNVFRVMTCGVMNEIYKARVTPGADGDFLATCLNRAFYDNLRPASI